MAKLIFWRIERLNDSTCYSIVAKTRKAGLEALAVERLSSYYSSNDYADVIEKVEVNYADAFDLMALVTGENGYYAGKAIGSYPIDNTPRYSWHGSCGYAYLSLDGTEVFSCLASLIDSPTDFGKIVNLKALWEKQKQA